MARQSVRTAAEVEAIFAPFFVNRSIPLTINLVAIQKIGKIPKMTSIELLLC